MPSIRQGPLPRDALSSARLRTSFPHGLAADTGAISTFSPCSCPCEPEQARPPSTRPVAGGSALLWISVLLADFCNLKRRTGTPVERSILAREWGFLAPLLAGTNRCRLRWSCGTSPRRTTCEPRPARRAGARRDPLTRATLGAGLGAGAKARPCRERRWAALLAALRAPGSPAGGGTRVGARMRATYGSRFIAYAVSRKAGVRGRTEVPSSVPKSMPRGEDGSSGRAGTAPPSRRLRGGIARGVARLLDRVSAAWP
jgi:hypothetical protein